MAAKHLISQKGSKLVADKMLLQTKIAATLFNFSFLILEMFTEKTNKENNVKLMERENFYLKSMSPPYNILKQAGSSLGYKHTPLNCRQ